MQRYHEFLKGLSQGIILSLLFLLGVVLGSLGTSLYDSSTPRLDKECAEAMAVAASQLDTATQRTSWCIDLLNMCVEDIRSIYGPRLDHPVPGEPNFTPE